MSFEFWLIPDIILSLLPHHACNAVADLDAQPWDFQAEECALRACVDRFNNRRYATNGSDPDFKPVDNCTLSVLGQDLELSEEFKDNYEMWLDMEVFSNQIDWDQIIQF